MPYVNAAPDIKQELPFNVQVIVTQKNNSPAIELRRLTTDLKTIKTIISCAFNSKPIIVVPKFTDELRSLNSLIDKGILHKKNDQFFFTI